MVGWFRSPSCPCLESPSRGVSKLEVVKTGEEEQLAARETLAFDKQEHSNKVKMYKLNFENLFLKGVLS